MVIIIDEIHLSVILTDAEKGKSSLDLKSYLSECSDFLKCGRFQTSHSSIKWHLQVQACHSLLLCKFHPHMSLPVGAFVVQTTRPVLADMKS